MFKTNILIDFQICISVPLNDYFSDKKFSKRGFHSKKGNNVEIRATPFNVSRVMVNKNGTFLFELVGGSIGKQLYLQL